ncbi:hypothetical protein RclHR1_08070009 [Rhizophagus clarus]|nr:hypothetical protein RclHR1_08070009 [Rhizophagus clarus]
MPVAIGTAQRERRIITRAGNWCDANPNLVGISISSQGCFTLPNGDIMGPDFGVVLTARWNALTQAQQDQAFPHVAPNFVIELRLQTDSPQYVHNKMLRWINGGVEEGWSIDRFVNPPEVSFNEKYKMIMLGFHPIGRNE